MHPFQPFVTMSMIIILYYHHFHLCFPPLISADIPPHSYLILLELRQLSHPKGKLHNKKRKEATTNS